MLKIVFRNFCFGLLKLRQQLYWLIVSHLQCWMATTNLDVLQHLLLSMENLKYLRWLGSFIFFMYWVTSRLKYLIHPKDNYDIRHISYFQCVESKS